MPTSLTRVLVAAVVFAAPVFAQGRPATTTTTKTASTEPAATSDWSGGGVAASAEGSGIDFAGQAGLRYFLNEKVALQGQIGFGYGTLGLGATWKF